MKAQVSKTSLAHIHPPRLLRPLFLAFAILFLARPLMACDLPGNTTDKPATQAVTDANNAFAFKLYKTLASSSKGQGQFFSPFSIFCALSMTSEGLAGQSLANLRTGLGLPDEATLHDGLMEIAKSLNAKDLPYTMALANAIWPSAGAAIEPKFLETIRKNYLGESKALDYGRDSEGSRKTINEWVEKLTHDRIKDLLPGGSVTPSTRMVLTNAIYFKGSWAEEFDKDLTQQQPFALDGGGSVDVPLMFNPADRTRLAYTEWEGTQVVEIPYKGDGLSMVVMLPKPGKIGQLEEKLGAEQWASIRESMFFQKVNVWLPRFKMSLGGSIKPQLSAVGLGGLFAKGDFSRMFTGGGGFAVSDVFHKAFVEVNEVGTEAAAATAVVVNETSAMPRPETIVNFRADHPFMFMIQQRATGNILFMGKVTDPSAKS